MSRDLGGFITLEEKRRPESVIRVKERINPNRFETMAFLRHLDLQQQNKMVLITEDHRY